LSALNSPPVVSVRKNPRKQNDCFTGEEHVPWNKDAFYLKERPAFVLDPLHHAGAYYVQEASSMLFANAIDFSEDLLALDLCAAPGGKSTLLLSLMNQDSLLISNEFLKDRAGILQENITRWGFPNVVVTNNKASDFEILQGFFDVVLVDAPCSGEGMMRKDKAVIDQWSEGLVKRCVADQKDILNSAVDLVKPGGILIFSTCTFEEAENEENVIWLHENYPGEFEPVVLPLDKNWGVKEELVEIGKVKHPVYYCFPHRVRGEGMFICCFRKTGEKSELKFRGAVKKGLFRQLSSAERKMVEPFVAQNEKISWLVKDNEVYLFPDKYSDLIQLILTKFKVLMGGIHAGGFKGKSFVPSHALAVSTELNKTVPQVDLSEDQALKFLKKEPFDIPVIPFKGWGVVTYKEIPLGWIKNLGNRFNNHFPAELKIRVDIDRYREKMLLREL
jgi:16S rRNA C967 or C1407 C5-methylase (RsmB/RsmF family)/NOL1/NOP2/fmu family ribosome biogenesis protein